MTLVYKAKGGLTGYDEYALSRADGKWYVRRIPYTRTKSIGSPKPWRPVSDDLALDLTLAVNPDDPPSIFSLRGTPMFILVSAARRLPYPVRV